MATMPTPSGVFTRASSGLVRQVRTDDVMYYGWQQIALSYIVFIVLAWGAYPGASMELASLLATVGGIAMGACYALFASIYPRSGGEYVFLSRTLHPIVGFAVSFSFAIWELFYFGVNGAFMSIYAISPILAALGVQTGNQALLDSSAWFGSGWGVFIPGTVMILTHAYLQYRGAGLWFRTQRWTSYVALVSLGITILVLGLAAAGTFSFQQNFDALAGSGAYQKVVDDGLAAGAAPAAPFDFGQTFNYMIWPAFSIWFAVASVSFSGEVKNVQRSQLLGIGGAMLVMGGAFVVLTFLYRTAFGGDFLLSAPAVETFPLAAPPFSPFFTAIAGGSPVLTILTSVWIVAIAFYVGGTTLIYSTRAMLAWSIDGVAPDRLGDVSERYHSPHWAIVVGVIVGEVFLGLFAFTDLLGPISGFLGLAISFLVVSLWAIFFPFLRKDVFENSPAAMRVAGVPVLSLLGIVASIFVVPSFYRLLVDTTFSIDLSFTIWGAVVVLAIAVVWFVAWQAYRQSQGVDVGRRYKEIPIE